MKRNNNKKLSEYSSSLVSHLGSKQFQNLEVFQCTLVFPTFLKNCRLRSELYSRFSRFFCSRLEWSAKRCLTNPAWEQMGAQGAAVRPAGRPTACGQKRWGLVLLFIAACGDPWPLYGAVQFTKHILIHYPIPSSQQSHKKQTLLAPFFSQRNWRLSKLKWFSWGH